MSRLRVTLLLCLAALLAACAPAAPPTPIVITGSVGTAVVGTAVPSVATPLPPGYTPPPAATQTSVPTLAGALSLTELKYHILSEFPDFFYCDPDYYPVAREDELALALERFAELQSNGEEFEAILAHNNLAGATTFSDEQKLLIYQEHKKLAAILLEPTGEAYRFQIQVAKAEGQGEAVTGQIDGQGKISVLERTASIATCPICLAAGTRIDTPAGPVPVESLRPGMLVWTLDSEGRRIAQPVLRVGKTAVPANHRMAHLVLEDGRQVWLSPGHPTAEGTPAGRLRAGEALSGGVIRSAERVPYGGQATYDLLPAGETGFYWANGILLDSTLSGSGSRQE